MLEQIRRNVCKVSCFFSLVECARVGNTKIKAVPAQGLHRLAGDSDKQLNHWKEG